MLAFVAVAVGIIVVVPICSMALTTGIDLLTVCLLLSSAVGFGLLAAWITLLLTSSNGYPEKIPRRLRSNAPGTQISEAEIAEFAGSTLEMFGMYTACLAEEFPKAAKVVKESRSPSSQ